MKYVYLLHIYGIEKTLKGHQEERDSDHIPLSPAERSCVGHAPCTRRTRLLQDWPKAGDVLSGHVYDLDVCKVKSSPVCDQDVCKATWEGFCVVSLVRSWLSVFQRSSIGSGWWLRQWEHRAGFRMVSCGVVSLVVSKHESSELPTGMGLVQQAQARASAAQQSNSLSRSLSSDKRLWQRELGTRIWKIVYY